MKYIYILLFFLILPLALHLSFNQKNTLYLYTWSNCINPDVIALFEKEHDYRIIIDTYDSNEAMYTKMKLGAAGYDIIFPSNYFLDLMSEQNMLLPLDEKKLPNASYIDTKFLHRLNLTPSPYGIPFLVCFTGIAYRKDILVHAEKSWDIFSQKSLAGRMTMLNDMREVLGAALRSLHYSANSSSPEEISQAGKKVLEWKQNLAKLESEQYKNGLATGEYYAVQGYSGDCLQLALESSNIDFIYPKEGTLATIDYAAIVASAKHIDMAYQFLNFLLTPKIAALNTEYTRFRSPNKEAKKLLPQSLQNSLLLYPEEDSSILLECIKPVPGKQKAYTEEWDRIKN